jgi:GT2 family glycosyltransferase
MKENSLKPLVGIVIINWNGLKDTIECIDSLAKISYTNYQTIVVDNGSENNEAAQIKEQHPQIILIANQCNEGFVGGVNQGIEKSLALRADYVLLLNNDTVVAPDFLQHLVEYAESSKKTVLGPKILYAGTTIIQNLGGKLMPIVGGGVNIGKGRSSADFQKILMPDFLSGCAMFIPKEAIEQVGLFDPVYFAYFEDADWSFRAKKAGYKLIILPKSIIWHKHSESLKKTPEKKLYYLGRNSIIFAGKNLHGLTKIIWLAGSIIMACLFLFLLGYDRKVRLARWKGMKEGFAVKRLCNEEYG